jgi:DNA repair exonuclease SbcCD ATPase subunit
MKLELTNFRCHLKKTYHFTEHQITLLKGDPGNGKSTVFNAIWWCLYGHLRGVGHHLSANSQTKVSLEFDQLPSLGRGVQIVRQNHPNKFVVTIEHPVDETLISQEDKACHQGEVAQQLIDQVFGSRETWRAVSYIIQGEQCLLMSGSERERLKLLEELSFHQDNPKEEISKIDQRLVQEREKFKIMDGTFQLECQRLTKELSMGNIPSNSTPELADRLERELIQSKQSQSQEQARESQRCQVSGLANHIQLEIEAIIKNPIFQQSEEDILNKLSRYSSQILEAEAKLEECQTKIAQFDATQGKDNLRIENELGAVYRERQLSLTNLNNIQYNLQQLKARQTQIQSEMQSTEVNLSQLDQLITDVNNQIDRETTRLSPLPNKENWPTMLQVGQLIQIEQDRQTNYQTALNLGIDYSPQIENLITESEVYLRNQEQRLLQFETINRVIRLRQQVRAKQEILKLPPITTLTETSQSQIQIEKIIAGKTEHLREKESSLALLSCPQCGQSLSVKDGNLTTDSRSPASPNEIHQLKIEISELGELRKLLANLSISWEGVEVESSSDEMINLDQLNQGIQEFRKRLMGLRQIRWISPPILSSVTAKDLVSLSLKYKDRDDLSSKKDNLHQLIQSFHVTSTSLTEEINQKQEELATLNDKIILPLESKISNLEKEKEESGKKLATSPIKKMREDLSLIKCQIEESRRERSKLEGVTTNRKILAEQLQNKQTKLEELKLSLQSLGQSILSVITTQIDEKTNLLSSVRRGIHILDWQRQLFIEREKLIEQQSSLADLEELRKIAERVEYQRLRETIASINTTMNQVFNSLFDDHITVELELFKTIKAGNRTKPHVNCLIYYKGSKYDQPSSVSGGEKNRLNLGMILALNLVSTSPLILLDECTCFLNNTLKIQCMETVREIIGQSKTIICVAHEDNDASYDNIIEVIPSAEVGFFQKQLHPVDQPVILRISNGQT